MTTKFTDYKNQLKNHTFKVLQDDGPVRAYYLQPAGGGRMESTLLVDTPEGIVIMGDWVPRLHGVISACGYNLDWFATPKDPESLAVKFGLQKEWQPDQAFEEAEPYLQSLLDDADLSREDYTDHIDTIRLACEEGNRFAFVEACEEAGLCDVSEFGLGYDPDDLGRLVAIQHRFAELWPARKVQQAKAKEDEKAAGLRRLEELRERAVGECLLCHAGLVSIVDSKDPTDRGYLLHCDECREVLLYGPYPTIDEARTAFLKEAKGSRQTVLA